MTAVSFARWPVTDADIDPGSDMPKPLDQWSAIKASRHQPPGIDCSPLYDSGVKKWVARTLGWALRPVGRRSGIPSGLNPAARVFGLRLPAANARRG